MICRSIVQFVVAALHDIIRIPTITENVTPAYQNLTFSPDAALRWRDIARHRRAIAHMVANMAPRSCPNDPWWRVAAH